MANKARLEENKLQARASDAAAGISWQRPVGTGSTSGGPNAAADTAMGPNGAADTAMGLLEGDSGGAEEEAKRCTGRPLQGTKGEAQVGSSSRDGGRGGGGGGAEAGGGIRGQQGGGGYKDVGALLDASPTPASTASTQQDSYKHFIV